MYPIPIPILIPVASDSDSDSYSISGSSDIDQGFLSFIRISGKYSYYTIIQFWTTFVKCLFVSQYTEQALFHNDNQYTLYGLEKVLSKNLNV